jgi:hypothetical protein
MDILRFKPNEPSAVHRFGGITAAPDLVTQGDPDAPVLLLLNGRKVLTAEAVALVAPTDFNLEKLHDLGPCEADDAGLTTKPRLRSQGPETNGQGSAVQV